MINLSIGLKVIKFRLANKLPAHVLFLLLNVNSHQFAKTYQGLDLELNLKLCEAGGDHPFDSNAVGTPTSWTVKRFASKHYPLSRQHLCFIQNVIGKQIT